MQLAVAIAELGPGEVMLPWHSCHETIIQNHGSFLAGLRVSKDTARYYLREAGGNVKTAIALCGAAHNSSFKGKGVVLDCALGSSLQTHITLDFKSMFLKFA